MKYILSALLVIVSVATMSCIGDHSGNSSHIETNKNIIQSKGFEVSSESTDLETSVTGTIFLSGPNGKSDHAQIVAWIEIDRNDWGGVVFYIPDGWQVSNKTSSYPEGDKSKNPVNHMSEWNTDSDKYDHNCKIEIGRDRAEPTNGGIGSVIVGLDATKEVRNSDKIFSVIVGVGCDEKDGVRRLYPDSKIVEVAIE